MTGKRRTPAELLSLVKRVAAEQGGQCTTRELARSTDPVTLVCGKGHEWKARAHDVVGSRRTWCRRCSYEKSHDALRLDIKTIQAYAKRQGGRLLSSQYTNALQSLRWECSHGHQWDATWANISQGKWCPTCRSAQGADARRLGIEVARELAKERNGECLSDEYIDNKSPLRWRCHLGHEWSAVLYAIKSGTWCPECARLSLSRSRKGRPPPLRRKIELSDLMAFARRHRGKCLTDFYVNQRQIFDWECKRGHRFRASWSNIQNRDNFCPKCADDSRKLEMLKTAHRFAKSKGGRCLSNTYVSARSPMKWQCDQGHQFIDSWVVVSNREYFCKQCALVSVDTAD